MRLTELVHQQLKATLQEGAVAIDATAGNGHDTLMLAQLVGSTGKVLAIDLQTVALDATRERLRAAQALEPCELLQGDHAVVLASLQERYREQIAAATFNLGYLPGGDKSLTTSPAQTRSALDAVGPLLREGGMLFVTAYRGHPGGYTEAATVESWMRALPEAIWQVEQHEPPATSPDRMPPILWIAFKKKGDPQAALR